VHLHLFKTESVQSSVARWCIFQNNNPNLGKFWKVFQCSISRTILLILLPNGMDILGPFGTFFGHLIYLSLSVLVCCTEKNLATLAQSHFKII
jgi:hypothetical protein